MTTTPASVVRPPTNDTEWRLLDTALTLFAEKGYEAASVREIIEAAGVTRPVLYYYCKDKEDLYQRLVHWKHDEAYQQLAEIIQQTVGCENRLRAIIRGSFAFCANDPRVARLMFQTHFGPTIPRISEFMASKAHDRFMLIYHVIEEGIKNNELTGGDAGAVTLLFCCIMDQHINVLSRLPEPMKRLTSEFADQLVTAFLGGVGTQSRSTPQLPNVFAGI